MRLISWGMDIDKLRARLMKREGQWILIAAAGGISRKTIARVLFEPGYNPGISTITAIEQGMRAVKYKRPRCKPRKR